MTQKFTIDEFLAPLIKAGELEVPGGPADEIASYFDTRNFRFHGPGGYQTDYAGLNAYFSVGQGGV